MLRPPLHLLRCNSLQHLVLLFLAVILSEQENLTCKKKKKKFKKKKKKKKKKIHILLWFEISVELNHFLIRLKPFLPISLFVTFFPQHLLPFPKHMLLNALEMEWCLMLSKILKGNGVLVSLLLTLNIFNTLF